MGLNLQITKQSPKIVGRWTGSLQQLSFLTHAYRIENGSV
jgi:hypothetical protein